MHKLNDSLQSIWSTDISAAEEILERARLAAALTLPWILPPSDQDHTQSLPENFNSIGSLGTTNMVSRYILSLFPPDTPWFELTLAPNILYDPLSQTSQQYQADVQVAQDNLFLLELMIQSVLETTRLEKRHRGSRVGFRTAMRQAIQQLIITGDTLFMMLDDFRFEVYRRDQYVTMRDGSGDVMYHITKKKVDPLALSDEILGAAQIVRAEEEDKRAVDRMKTMYTRTEWDNQKNDWKITQEIDEFVVNEYRERVSSFISVPFDLVSGENYGRGFIEQNLGDLRSHNELRERMLDWAALASKFLFFVNINSQIRDDDLAKSSGEIVRGGDVQNGKINDIALLAIDKIADFGVVERVNAGIRKDLGAAMLLESEITPRGDRVTATQAQRIGFENELTSGGSYATIAESMQVPILRLTVFRMQLKGILPKLPEEAIEYRAISGLAALSDELKGQRVLTLMQAITAMGDTAMAEIDIPTLIKVLSRYSNVHEPGLIKSDEQKQADAQRQLSQQAQAQATEQAIDTAGAIVEGQALQGGR